MGACAPGRAVHCQKCRPWAGASLAQLREEFGPTLVIPAAHVERIDRLLPDWATSQQPMGVWERPGNKAPGSAITHRRCGSTTRYLPERRSIERDGKPPAWSRIDEVQ